MDDNFDNIKKIKMLGELFIWIGKDKIVLKDLKENPSEHITMLFGASGELDIHKSKEGTVKKYESLVKINLEDTIKNMLSSGFTKEKLIQELYSNSIKVDFTEKEFLDYKIVNQKGREMLLNGMIKKKKEARLTPESIQNMDLDALLLPWNKGKQFVTDNCMVVMENSRPVGGVFKKDEEYFFFSLEALSKNPVMSFIEKLISD